MNINLAEESGKITFIELLTLQLAASLRLHQTSHAATMNQIMAKKSV